MDLASCDARSQLGSPAARPGGLSLIEAILLFLLGLGTLTFGAWPRRTAAVVYGYLVWSFLIEFLGAIVRASYWLMDTSIFFHLAPAPAASPDWASAAVVTGLGLAGAVIGAILFSRRDVIQA